MRLLTGCQLSEREREIELEYREPMAVVIRGFADMGYSRSDVAAILGYSRPDFTRRVLPRHDPNNEINWPGRGEGRAQQEQAA